jgi:Esterase/lipase
MARLLRRCVLSCLVAGAVLGHPARAEETMERLTVHRDLPYADHERGRLDLYAPDGAEGAPVVLFVHGGALLFGDKSLAAHVGLRLAREDVVTVAVNHRFSPAVSHPAHVRDVAAALRWVVDHVAEHGGDPKRIVLAGHSSGGYLAALLAVDPRWLAELELDADRIAGLVSISGFHYVDRLAPLRPKHVWGEDPEAWVDASPAHRATEAAPPALLLWADGDAEDRRVDGRDFAAALGALGVATRSREIADRDHRSIFFLLGSAGDPATEAIVDFLDEVVPRG